MNTPDAWLQVLLECNRSDFTPLTLGALAAPEQGTVLFVTTSPAVAEDGPLLGLGACITPRSRKGGV